MCNAIKLLKTFFIQSVDTASSTNTFLTEHANYGAPGSESDDSDWIELDSVMSHHRTGASRLHVHKDFANSFGDLFDDDDIT